MDGRRGDVEAAAAGGDSTRPVGSGAPVRRTKPLVPLLVAGLAAVSADAIAPVQLPASRRFEVALAPGLVSSPQSGRLLVVLGPPSEPEPRRSIGRTGLDASPLLGVDVEELVPGRIAVVDDTAAIFPLARLSDLVPGAYRVQAVLMNNPAIRAPDAPGTLYSEPVLARLDPARGWQVRLTLSARLPDETPPPETEHVRYVSVRSALLSRFHGRPIWMRAGVVLPRNFAREPNRRYPLRVHIGGYGTGYRAVARLMSDGSPFRAAWLDPEAPPMVLVHLDGAGPLGDPYQVNSANHGPYGDAITQELIPYVERAFRGIGEGWARVLDGTSTGGWVALALQIFYPDFFNGAWAFCPDSVDFRAFQLLNIYEDLNAYVNEHGFERPSARDPDGDVRFTMRHECQMENVLGTGGLWTLSGRQWGAWNATYGPRGSDGRPVPLWDPATGVIDRTVLDYWRQYDLRLVLERNWKTLGPKLRGKLHIWVGEADDYFLNNAVHLLERFLASADPPFEGTITFGPGAGHCWVPLDARALAEAMARRIRDTGHSW